VVRNAENKENLMMLRIINAKKKNWQKKKLYLDKVVEHVVIMAQLYLSSQTLEPTHVAFDQRHPSSPCQMWDHFQPCKIVVVSLVKTFFFT